ncbi:protein FAM161A isoform X2 [Cyclopterus lumpus]|uniref:protein FAM161A isoform X2 n=1 Tax=Cyclopterus lumpus TaxID=8103 RepID=UPI0014874D2B|nr:protein FAM161A isoform X2 [Cyclopterus lumpus]
MANAHRTNVLVTSCLKTPVDPRTRAPLASYERERVLPHAATCHRDHRDHRHRDEELEYEDSGSDSCDEDHVGKKGGPLATADYRGAGDRLDLSEIFFSNEEYYSKLEELKKAHLRTMAELESMYRQKLQLRAVAPLEAGGHRLLWSSSSPAASRRLRKSLSAVELRRSSGASDSADGDEDATDEVGNGPLFSPKEHIKNMWRDFRLSPHHHHLSSSSVHSLPAGQGTPPKGKGRKRREDGEEEEELWRHRLTVPKPFQMMLREAERQKRGVKSRAQIEQENAELRRRLEELTECQKKFRAAAVPAHVHLPLYEELRERKEERRRRREDQHPRSAQKPFSFLERERLKKEQKQLHPQQQPSDQEAVKPFKAKPVPKAVYAAASGEQMKEEQLYRSIKIQMRAQEMLHSASMPRSMLARRLSDRKKTGEEGGAAAASGDDSFSHRPHINAEVPDFNASYRRFQRHLEKQKGAKPTTACEPFELRTSRITSHRERILADIEKEQSSPRTSRWPYVSPGPARRATSSRCSSLSGSLELLPTKVTDASKKREEAVRKVLEERKKADEEEERWKERQKRREKKLQRVVLKRAQANDPHLALSQTHPTKLKEFRKQELQRKKEYEQEIKEMQQRVKGRPLLLEQVAQRNAKQAAEKRFTDAVHGCDLTEEFISSTAARRASAAGDGKHSTDMRRSSVC